MPRACALRLQTLEQPVESAFEQQRSRRAFLRSVRVKLDEDVRADARGEIEPAPHSIRRRQIACGDLAVLEARQESLSEAQSERPRNHEQIARSGSAGAHGDA